MEVACAPDSLLTSEAHAKGLSAVRAGLFNGCDLTSPEGLRKTLNMVKRHRPINMWISTECGAFSPIQNFNQRTEQQRKDLQDKQREARKQHIGGLVVAYYARSVGCHVHWEWSRRCRAWKWEHVDRFRANMNTATAIISGCRVGLKDSQNRGLLGKEWRVESTNPNFASKLHLTCRGVECEGLKCEGLTTRQTAFYTPQMVRRIVFYMKKTHVEDIMTHLHDTEKSSGLERVHLGKYRRGQCNCSMFQEKGTLQMCPRCILTEQALVGEEEPWEVRTWTWTRKVRQVRKV